MRKKAMLGLCIIFLLVLATVSFATQTNIALTYDANGNLLTNGDKRYVYDGFNRLAEVFINETIKEKYWYDPDGNRLLKVEFHSDGSNTTTFYIDESFVRIMNASGTYDEVYYYDEYDLIAKEDAEGKKFYHPDHLGSTTLVTDEQGNVVEETVYDPFGAVQEGGDQRYDYEGKETDFSGLQYFGARYYDPNKIFKWTQPDTLLPDVYDPQQLNRYSFERNNPYKNKDPDGHVISEIVAVARILLNPSKENIKSFGVMVGTDNLLTAGIGSATLGVGGFIWEISSDIHTVNSWQKVGTKEFFYNYEYNELWDDPLSIAVVKTLIGGENAGNDEKDNNKISSEEDNPSIVNPPIPPSTRDIQPSLQNNNGGLNQNRNNGDGPNNPGSNGSGDHRGDSYAKIIARLKGISNN